MTIYFINNNVPFKKPIVAKYDPEPTNRRKNKILKRMFNELSEKVIPVMNLWCKICYCSKILNKESLLFVKNTLDNLTINFTSNSLQSYFEKLLESHIVYVKNKINLSYENECSRSFGNFNKIITTCASELTLRNNLKSLKHLFRCYAILSFILNEIYETLNKVSILNII